jgi:hypothetical protein
MRRWTILIVIIMLVLGACVLGYYLWNSKTATPPLPIPLPPQSITPPPVGPTPVTPLPIPVEDTIMIGTPQGSVVVKNFYKNAVQVSEYGVLVRRTNLYDIVYFQVESRFLITISDLPVDVAVRAAEKELLDILGITQADACRLTVSLAVPRFTDPALSGKEFGLSFCIGQTTPLGGTQE